MTKLLIGLMVIIAAGGVFLFTQQPAEAPTNTNTETGSVTTGDNPFGEGAEVVGTVDDSDGSVSDDVDDDTSASSGTSGSGTTGGGSTGSTGTTGTTAGTISRAELATHNTQANCWVGYKGVVYDITAWLPKHPGSAGAIAPFCGTADEFAAAFNRKHGTKQEGRLEREGIKEGTLGN